MNQAGGETILAQPRRGAFLASAMLEQGYKTFVEVGCKEGRTTGHILKNVPDSRVVAIDPWCAMPDQKGVVGGETYEEWDFAKIEAEFWQNVGDGKDRVKHLRETSQQAWLMNDGLKEPDGSDILYDLIFIDAAHDYSNVKLDIRRWWPLVRPGGMLAGHDFKHKWPGVERAVAECFDLMRVGVGPDSIWFVLKTGDTDVRP